MKWLTTLLLTISATQFTQANTQNIKIDNNEHNTKTVQINYEDLNKVVNSMNPHIGSYPPKFKNEQEKQAIYEKWTFILNIAEKFEQNSEHKESALYLLAELNRQGHNMDVEGAAEKTQQYLNTCLTQYPNSVRCHFSASYFYLSIGLNHLKQAEQSLEFLRAHFKQELNPEVEAGYVFLYLYQQDLKQATKQIKYYISIFPNTRRAIEFADILKNLDSIEVKTN